MLEYGNGQSIEKPRTNWFTKIFLIIFGGIFLAGGLFYCSREAELQTKGVKTEGEVTSLHQEMESDSDGSDSLYTYPIVNFTTKEGLKVDFQSSNDVGAHSMKVGQAVNVIYMADNPSRAEIDNGWLSLGFGAIFALVGAVLVAIGIFMGKETGGLHVMNVKRANPYEDEDI